jgi:phosphoribosylformylglycinamidine synthase
MPSPNVLVLRAPGTNCDQESALAFRLAGAKTEILHVNRLLDSPRLLDRFQILCIPGGFSYGDDVAAGRILANQLEHHLTEPLAQFHAGGKLILGICNGFQVMIRSGILLPADAEHGPPATLTLNDSGKYEDRWVRLEVRGGKCVFLEGIHSMYLPVAHAEGKFVARDAGVLAGLESAGQLVLRYVSQGPAKQTAKSPLSFPDNPNGSMADVAGLCDRSGRVLGLMPHPERHIDPTQHPRWTRGEAGPVGDGFQVFLNAVGYFR